MADTKTKIVKLKVELDDRGLVKYVSEVKEAGRETDKLGRSGGWKQLNQDLAAIAAKAAIGAAALTGFFKGADALSQVGQSALRSRAALESLTDSTAEYEQKVRAVQQATRGLTTESEAAAIAARLQQFGLAESATEMQKFVDTIVRVGAVNPMLGDTTEAINQIQLTLSNMSFMRLDQLGLSAGAVRKRMAELKDTTQDMTNEAAFQQAVMEGLAEQAARVDDAMLDIGRSQGRVKTHLRELGDDIGIYVNEKLEIAATSALQLYDILTQLGLKETIIRLSVEVFKPDQSRASAKETLNTLLGIPTGDEQFGGHGMIMPGSKVPPQWAARDAVIDWFTRWATPNTGPRTTFNLDAWQARQGVTRFQQTGFASSRADTIDPTLLENGLVINQATLAGRDREQAAVMAQRRQRQLTTGPGFELMQAAQTGMGWASGQTDALVSSIAGNVGLLADKLFSAGDAASRFAEQAERFTSLNEMFGVAPEALDADIYNRAADALHRADLEAEAEAEAIRVLGIEMGVTNVTNEVFNDRLDSLAEALAEGSITAADYVEQVRALQTFDWSRIQAFADSMDPARAAEFASALGAPGGQEAFDVAYEKLQQIGDLLQPAEGDEEGMGLFGSVDSQASMFEDSMFDRNKRMTEDAAKTWGEISSSGTTAVQEMDTANEQAVAHMRATWAALNFTLRVESRLEQVGDYYQSQALGRSLTDRGPGTNYATGGDVDPATGERRPEFAEGGYTGDGASPFLAMLHPREVVVPLDKIGRGGAAVPRIPQMTTAGISRQRFEADTPVEVSLDGAVFLRFIARSRYRSNVEGMVPANG